MLYFVIVDMTTFFSTFIVVSCMIFLGCLYLIPLKSSHYLIRKSTLWINCVSVIILLVLIIFSYLLNYEIESIFHMARNQLNSISIILGVNITLLVLTLIFMGYILGFNYLFLLYSKENVLYAGALKAKKYVLKSNKIKNIKTEKKFNQKAWINVSEWKLKKKS